MLPPRHRLIEPAHRPVHTTSPAATLGAQLHRPARPGRPPVMRPPLPVRTLALANWQAYFASREAAS